MNKMIWGLKQKINALLLSDDLPEQNQAPTRALLRAFSDRYGMSDVLPYESYDEQTEIYYNDDTAGFMLYCMPSTGLAEKDLSALYGVFKGQYPENSSVQVTLVSDSNIEGILDNWAAAKDKAELRESREMLRFLAKKRVDFLKKGKWESVVDGQPYILRNYHLIVSFTIPTDKMGSDLPREEIDRIGRVKKNFISSLGSAGLPAMNLEPGHFLDIMNAILNPSHEKQPVLEYDENNLIKNQIMQRDTEIQWGASGASVSSNGEEYSIIPFHVRQYPKQWSGAHNGEFLGSFTDDIKRIGCPFLITLSVSIPDQTEVKTMTTANSTRATQMKDSPIAKYVVQWAEREQDWKHTADALDNGNKLLESCHQIVLFPRKGKEEDVTEGLMSLYGELGWVLNKSRYTTLISLLNALPMGAGVEIKRAMKIFKYYRRMLSDTCTHVAPFVGEYKGTGDPAMLLSGRRGQLNYFDPFSNKKGNYNMAVCATSGAGKSFVIQDFTYNILGSGGRVFIIDAGHSYRNLCNLVGGTYIDFGDTSKRLCINPFTNISESDHVIEVDDDIKDRMFAMSHFEEQLPMLKLLIIQMATGGQETISREQEAFIERAIQEVWAEKKSKACVNDVIEQLKKDDTDEAQGKKTGLGIAQMLYSFSENGMYNRYVNGENTIDLENTFVVLDLDALQKTRDLQSVALLMMIMQITQTMYLSGNKAQKKVCVIDEAWRLMGDGKAAGESIEEGYRVARKHNGAFCAITQGAPDFYKSDAAKAALQNADFEIYLRQKPSTLAEAVSKNMIDDSDGRVAVLKTLTTQQGLYSEMAIISPDGLSVNRLIVDRFTSKVFSTTPKDVAFIRARKEQGFSLIEAITDLVEQEEQQSIRGM